MKNKMNLTEANIVFIFTTFVVSLLLSQASQAGSSLELSCRIKAKELAAETYKGCMTEGRQSQIEQIRKDYKEKLSELKNHYDEKLKKLSGANQNGANNSSGSEKNNAANNSVVASGGGSLNSAALKAEMRKSDSRPKSRSSGARMPQKKSTTTVIDFTAPVVTPSAAESQNSTDESQSDENQSQVASHDEIEVVELPVQQ